MKRKKAPIILQNVTISQYAAEGKSLAKIDGKVIFVERTIPGDVVDVQLTKNKTSWAEGFPINFVSYSVDRVQPFCQHFGTCGGCQWQMLPYPLQLQFKQQQVAEHLQHIAKIPIPEILPIIGCETQTKYRNKIEYTFSNKRFIPNEEFKELKKQGVDINQFGNGFAGFHARGVFDKIVAIKQCHLQAEPTNIIRETIAQYCLQNQISFYDIKTHEGFLRNCMIRITTTGEIMVNVVVGYNNKELIEALMNHVLQQVPSITTLLYTVNTKLNDTIYNLEPVIFFGKGYIEETLGNYRYKISPKSFFQTNSKQGEKLYAVTQAFAELTGKEIVYDLYCGTGSIGIFVSQQAKKIIGVETVEDAIEDAKLNAQLNNLQHTHFFAGDVIKVCTNDFFAKHGKPHVVITDPPRAGMHEKLVEKLLEMEAPIIVYVSCNPATQARDIALLHAKYEVTKIQPVDMFPHTLHIENVIQLKLRSGV